jgi:S-adenosylmethionine synthetase
VVAAGLADRCLIQVAYAIGVADPMSLYVEHRGHRQGRRAQAREGAVGHLPAAPTNIRRGLQLNKPIYQRTARTAISAASRRRTAPSRGRSSTSCRS